MNSRRLLASVVFFLTPLLFVFSATNAHATDTLVSAYSLNEGSGTSVSDSSSNLNTGTVSSPSWSTQGKYGNALTFGNSSRRVIVPDSDSLDLTTGLTVSAWVYPTSNRYGWDTIVYKEQPGNLVYGLYMGNTNTRPYGYIYVNGARRQVYSTTSMPLNQWSYLTMTYNGAQLKLYVNGVLRATTNYAGSVLTSSGPLNIGGNGVSTSEYFPGRIDEVRVYNIALGQPEIATDMNTPITAPTLTPTPSPTPTATPTPTPTITPTPSPSSTPIAMGGVLRVSPQNSRYFTNDSGKAVVLNGTHTWRNFQMIGPAPQTDNFDFNAYLNFLSANNLNYTRLWTWETDRAAAGWSVSDLVSPIPFLKVGSQYDLTQFNQDFFDRLRQRVIDAAARGIYVDVQLFNGWSVGPKNGGPNPWAYHPFNENNNVNQVDGDINNDGYGYEAQTLAETNAAIVAIQENYVRKVVDTLNDLDNVVFEIANETESGNAVAWQNHMISVIRSHESTKPKQHVVGFSAPYPNTGNNDDIFASSADWISPNPNDISGYNYQTNPRPNTGSKVITSDTDHLWGLGGDRAWAWKSFTRGLQATYMDCYTEDSIGCPISQTDPIRVSLLANLGYIRTYANKMDLLASTPQTSVSSTGYALVNPGQEYLVYQPLGGEFTVDLSSTPNVFSVEWLNPSTGNVSGSTSVSGGAVTAFLPPFGGDAVLYLKLESVPTPTPTPSPTPTPTPTPVPTDTPTPTPTVTPEPTPTPIPTPSPSPSPTPTPTPSPTPTPTPTPSPDTGLMGHWNLDENSGSTALDASGNGFSGVISNPLWVLGKYNSALNMTANAKMERITVNDPSNGKLDIDASTDFTMSSWVKTASFSESPTLIQKAANLSETLPGYALFVSAAGGSNALTCQIYDNVSGTATDSVTVYTDANLTDGVWHNITCSLDRNGSEYGSSGLRLFIDGLLAGTDATINSTGSLANSDSLILGENSATKELGGTMDDIRIYNRALTETEIQSLAASI